MIVLLPASALSGMCGYRVHERLLSPGGDHEAVIVGVDCGATGPAVIAVAFESGWFRSWWHDDPYDEVVVSETLDRAFLRIRWADDSTLEVGYPQGREDELFQPTRQRSARDGQVVVSYREY